MLGKLFKHEWKATYKLCSALILFIVAMTILGCVSFTTPMWGNAFREGNFNRITMLDILGILTLVGYVLALVGIAWAFYIYMGVHFYRTMYSEQGYLTHTLPVTSHQLLISKILVSAIWHLIINVMIFLSVVVLLYTMFSTAFRMAGHEGSLWSYIMANKDMLFSYKNEPYIKEFINVMIQMLIIAFISLFTTLIIMFGAITLGQLSGKHKVAMSIISYLVISVCISIITSIVNIPLNISKSYIMTEGPSVEMISTNWVSMIIVIAFSVGLYFTSNYIINKRLNLE